MCSNTTWRRTTILVALTWPFLFLLGKAPAQPPAALAALKSSYETATMEIGLTYVQREQDALKQYGKALDALLAALKRKGDLETFLVVDTEKKRFSTDGTVPPAMAYLPALAEPVKACREAVAEAKAELNRQTAVLLKKYVVALDDRIRQLMLADQIEESKLVMTERNKVVLALAGAEAKLPKEVPPVPAVSEAKPPAKQLIPIGAKVFLGHHYLFMPEKLSWQDAKKVCEGMDGHLVTITSKEENEFVFKLTSKKKNTWIGCTDEQQEGTWEWVTGEKFLFKHWADGEPSNFNNADYGHYWDRYPSHWGATVDAPDSPLGYVCEWDR